MDMHVLLVTTIMVGSIGESALAILREQGWVRVLSRVTANCIQLVRGNIATGDRWTPSRAWRYFQSAEADPAFYMVNWEFGGRTKTLLVRHPNSMYHLLEDIWDASGGTAVNALAISNDLLMGPAGSGSFLHLDTPLPFAVRIVVLWGVKLVCWCHVDVGKIPHTIRTSSSVDDQGVMSRAEYDAVARFCEAHGGAAVELRPGKYVSCICGRGYACLTMCVLGRR